MRICTILYNFIITLQCDFERSLVTNGSRNMKYIHGISTDDKTVFGTKEYQINLFFEGSDDDATTGIRAINHPIADKEGYYTLQGIRVNKPVRAGIYIHNGKKIIVK